MIYFLNINETMNTYMSILQDFKYLIFIVGIIIVAIILSKLTLRFLKRHFEKSARFGEMDQTNYNFFKNAIKFTYVITAIIIIFYSIPALHSIGVTLFAGAGIFAAIIGFASQQAFSNIIGGIFIVIFKPFHVNDMLKVGNNEWGVVEDITLRHTVIRSFENRRYVIPNSVISSETLLNASLTDDHICVFVEMNISYDSDEDLATQIMQEEAIKHPDFWDHRTEDEKNDNVPAVVVRLISFDESSIKLRAYVWTKDPFVAFTLKTDLFRTYKKRFEAAGIEIPYPYRTLVYKNEKNKTTQKEAQPE